MFKMNEKAMAAAMKKMGISQQHIDAKEVIIKTADNDLIIRNPSVVKVNMGGSEMFQISGDVEENTGISDEDITTVSEQANVDKEKARNALEKSNGDLAEAILKLKG